MRHDLSERLRRARGFVFDMDGTLVLGDKGHHGYHPLPGALDCLNRLKSAGLPFVVVTSGSAQTPGDYAATLRQLGFPVEDRAMQTPASVAADYFARRKIRRVMVLGAEGARRPLAEAGLEVVPPEGTPQADAVFIGFYRDFTFQQIEAACHAIWQGATLYTSAYAKFFAAANGRAIGIPRAICTMIRGITGCPVTILGKPSLVALRCAARVMGVKPAELVVVGDDPSLEIAMALRGGALAVGVTSGLATRADFAALPPGKQPHLVLDDVGKLKAALETGG